jgi:hypothetical protein
MQVVSHQTSIALHRTERIDRSKQAGSRYRTSHRTLNKLATSIINESSKGLAMGDKSKKDKDKNQNRGPRSKIVTLPFLDC